MSGGGRLAKRCARILAAAACIVLFGSCLTLAESLDMLASQASGGGFLDLYQSALLRVAANAAMDASRRLDPEEEYYIGRAVAASIFSRYPACDRPVLNEYLNKLGQGLSLYSRRPEIYAGYRFFALDTPEVNAFATPGGHILVTRGLLAAARSEDELAAALAHEIAHVSLGHGLASVQGARVARIVTDYALDAGRTSGGEAAAFADMFGEAISELAGIIVVSGYSQTLEFQADMEARRILAAAGYDPNALERLIGRLPGKGQDAGGFAVTHPEPAGRIEALRAFPFDAARRSAPRWIRSTSVAGTWDEMSRALSSAGPPTGSESAPVPLPQPENLLYGSPFGMTPLDTAFARAARFEAMKEHF